MKKAFFLIGLLLVTFFFKENVFAKETIECSNRYATLVNPVRGRALWIDKTINPLKNQYNLAKQYNFPVTWLLQYDVLKDEEILREIKKFDSLHEIGVFLEVSQKYADESRVIYPYNSPWFSPNAVFLSGYSQSNRRRLIDKLFKDFKSQFGYYPLSVGAWWIDSYSLNYLKEKYDIKAAIIVADQKTTDNYGVWGAWWGVPYYPAKANILTPANKLNNKQEVVILQWAQRDPGLAYGEGPSFSNYSLQANDYIRQGKNTGYFIELAGQYLSCVNKVGQVTVGIETGSDSVVYFSELEKQYQSLRKIPGLNFVTVTHFAKKFSQIYPQLNEKTIIGEQENSFIMTVLQRERVSNKKEVINYQQNISFKDYFLADQSTFLDRRLPNVSKKEETLIPWFLIVVVLIGIYATLKKTLGLWISGTLFTVASFGLILRSTYQYGWQVFYGPVVPVLIYLQILIVLSFFCLLFILYTILKSKKKNLFYLYFLPLSFGLDPLIGSARFTLISNVYYLGFAVDNLRLIGFSYQQPYIKFINKDFPAYQSSALLKLNVVGLQDNLWIFLILYPLFHVIVSFILSYFLIRLPVKIKFGVLGVFIILLLWHLINIFQMDPQSILLIK